MMSVQDNILFDLGAAATRNIIVDAEKLGSGGSFVLVTSTDAMTALLNQTFTVYETGSDTPAFDLTVGGGIISWNNYDWKLELNSSSTSLTLSWTRSTTLTQTTAAMMSSSPWTEDLQRSRNTSLFSTSLAAPSLF